jgi:signal transduction histidine kinase/phage shock protein PspC (stress-responsive transcriptional regulator)
MVRAPRGRDHQGIDPSTSSPPPPPPSGPPSPYPLRPPEAGNGTGTGAGQWQPGRPRRHPRRSWERRWSGDPGAWGPWRNDYDHTHHHAHRGWWRTSRDPGPLRRSRDDRLIGGVASGLARKIGVDPTVVRLGFVVGSLMSGFGVAVYIGAWLLVPAEGHDDTLAARTVHDRRGIAVALSFIPILVVLSFLSSALRVSWIGTAAIPLCLGAAGFILVWRNVDDDERVRLQRAFGPVVRLGSRKGTWRALAVRIFLGVLLVAGGVSALTVGTNRLVLLPLAGVFLVVAGAVVVFGPWWLQVVRDLIDERQARALAEERADIAARVHDSVLQTLALIQRRSDQPQQVMKLARAQERELRSWLFEGRVPGPSDGEDTMLGEAIGRIQREVESVHEVSVETVEVGDCALDDHLRALVEAGREATVNAAKWSGAQVVSLFVEVERDKVTMFVRDRGKGFEPSDVATDRRGVAESIYGRMARHGGQADVRSTPGVGTEVFLEMPRSEDAHHPGPATSDPTAHEDSR